MQVYTIRLVFHVGRPFSGATSGSKGFRLGFAEKRNPERINHLPTWTFRTQSALEISGAFSQVTPSLEGAGTHSPGIHREKHHITLTRPSAPGKPRKCLGSVGSKLGQRFLHVSDSASQVFERSADHFRKEHLTVSSGFSSSSASQVFQVLGGSSPLQPVAHTPHATRPPRPDAPYAALELAAGAGRPESVLGLEDLLDALDQPRPRGRRSRLTNTKQRCGGASLSSRGEHWFWSSFLLGSCFAVWDTALGVRRDQVSSEPCFRGIE